MKRFFFFSAPGFVAVLAALSGCTPTQNAKIVTTLEAHPVAGQLFCQITTNGGGTVVVGLIDAAASANAPAEAPVVIMATNALQSAVDADCAVAAQEEGGKAGVPVSPPLTAVGNVAITKPTS